MTEESIHELLGGRLELPAWEYKHSRVTVEGSAQHLGPLNTQVDPTILDTGDCRLGNAALCRELSLTKALQLTDDPHRLTRSDIDALFGGDELAHISVSDSHVE